MHASSAGGSGEVVQLAAAVLQCCMDEYNIIRTVLRYTTMYVVGD